MSQFKPRLRIEQHPRAVAADICGRKQKYPMRIRFHSDWLGSANIHGANGLVQLTGAKAENERPRQAAKRVQVILVVVLLFALEGLIEMRLTSASGGPGRTRPTVSRRE